MQCWHGVVLVFNANEHMHGSTKDGFHSSYAAKGSFKLGGALYMNTRAQLEARKESDKLRNDVVPGRYMPPPGIDIIPQRQTQWYSLKSLRRNGR